MAFHDVQLPTQVEKGASGGPRFKTTVIALGSGFERRNIEWEATRAAYDISYGIQSKENFDDVLDFFYARQGRAHSFRFKDWTDYEIASQAIGVTDGTTTDFPLFKRYSSGATDFDRTITRPVASGWAIADINAVGVTVVYNTAPGATEASINTTTGVVTLGATHAATSTEAITVTGEFDVPCRFDTDQLSLSAETWDAASIEGINIVEVRGE